MNKRDYERIIRKISQMRVYAPNLPNSLFLIPTPSMENLKNPSIQTMELLQIYYKSLKQYEKNVRKRYEEDIKLFQQTNQFVGGNPLFKTYLPFPVFKTYEEILSTSGVEGLAQYYKKIRYRSSKLASLRTLKENYLKSFKTLMDATDIPADYMRWVESTYNYLERTSLSKLYGYIITGRLPEIAEFYKRGSWQYLYELCVLIRGGLGHTRKSRK